MTVAEGMHEMGVWGGCVVDVEEALKGRRWEERETWRLRQEGYREREIGVMLGKSERSVQEYVRVLRGTVMSLLGCGYGG